MIEKSMEQQLVQRCIIQEATIEMLNKKYKSAIEVIKFYASENMICEDCHGSCDDKNNVGYISFDWGTKAKQFLKENGVV